MICICGTDCGTCPHLDKDCAGCDALAGRVFWTGYIGADVCPVYKCAKDKEYRHCGDCPEIPCELWHSLKDPSWSDEEHQKSILDRLAALKKDNK
jgi:hypothetical protein